DVFVQVFRFRHRYRPQSRFSTWLFTIATNLCLNEVRRPERHLRVDLWNRRDGEERAEGPPLPDPTAVTPEQGAAARQLERRLEGHVAGCPECRREVAATEAVLAGVTGLARSGCEVPSHLEQATFRRVRLLAAAEEEGSVARRWWAGFRIPALAFATAAVAIVAVELTRGAGDRRAAPSGPRAVAQAPARDKPRVVASR